MCERPYPDPEDEVVLEGGMGGTGWLACLLVSKSLCSHLFLHYDRL